MRREPGTTEVRIVEKERKSSGKSSSNKVISSADSPKDETNLGPLQKQATMTQRLLGALQQEFDSMKGQVADHDARIIKLENKTKSHDGLHKQGKSSSLIVYLISSCLELERGDIDELMERVSKLENSASIASALSGAEFGENQIELILKAINDMQDKINAEMDKKLENYVT